MHEALGTVEQGAVRFSFSHYNTEQEVETAIEAVRELAEERAIMNSSLAPFAKRPFRASP